MKIIIISDSHGRSEVVKRIIAAHRDAEVIIFLGDGEKDLESGLAENGYVCFDDDIYQMKRETGGLSEEQPKQSQKRVYRVCGNCDRDSRGAVTLIREIDGIKFYLTHGFEQGVKHGLKRLAAFAKDAGCRAALFGHTHVMHYSCLDGVELFNRAAQPMELRSGYRFRKKHEV